MKKEEIENLIKELDLPAMVLEIFNKTDKAKLLNLDIEYSCPSEFFIMTDEELEPFKTSSIIPFMCDGSFYTIYAYDIKRKAFLTYNIEEGITSEDRYKWDALFIKDILNWWEEEISDEEILERGKLLGINHINGILKCIEELGEDISVDIEKWEQNVIEKFNLEIKS